MTLFLEEKDLNISEAVVVTATLDGSAGSGGKYEVESLEKIKSTKTRRLKESRGDIYEKILMKEK